MMSLTGKSAAVAVVQTEIIHVEKDLFTRLQISN
jgi:hypothetical protein